MSTAMMIKAWEHAESDSSLTTGQKLVLLRWAWKCRDGAPAVVQYKTYARDLSMSVNGVKKCVAGLIAKGYMVAQAVVVTAGEKMALAQNEGDHSVTPEGSPSDPQRDHSVTPIQNNKYKKARARSRVPSIPSGVRSALNALDWPDCDERETIEAYVKAEGFGHLLRREGNGKAQFDSCAA